MPQFEVVRLGVQWETLPGIVHSLVEGLHLSVRESIELRLINVLLSQHGPQGPIEVVPAVSEMHHLAPAGRYREMLALL